MSEIINGSRTSFGPRTVETKAPSIVNDVEKILVVPFNFDDLPAVSAEDATVISIPAGSYIESAVFETVEAFAGGTSYVIGLAEPDGTVVDADGLFASTALSAINAAGKWVTGGGALVGAAVGGADVQVTATATGTFTAGKGRLIIKYIAPSA